MRQKLMQLYGPVDYSKPESIELEFTEQQAAELFFELKGEYWIIKTRHHLDPQIFADISATVRRLGGEYISAGKDSHFKVRKA